jgi:purine-binding chemotaxis protein CheW
MSSDALQHHHTGQSGSPQQFLAFNLGDEEYPIDIRQVQELRGVGQVTRIARAPDYVRGVLNLRCLIVPVLDLRLRLNMPQRDYDAFTVVIILNVGTRTVGIAVDSVSDVAMLEDSQIKPAPAFDGNVAGDYLLGLGTIDERMLVLMNLDRLLSDTVFTNNSTLH